MLFVGVLAAALAATPGGCETASSDSQRASCLLAELQAADDQINKTYGDLRARLNDSGRLTLRDAQRAWIKRRDQVCGLNSSEGDRAVWLTGLSKDYAKTVCVVRFTNARATELQVQAGAPQASAQPPAPTQAQTAVYDLTNVTPKMTGKWYFEAAVDVGGLAKANEQALFVGVRGRGQSVGTLIAIHRRDIGRAPGNVGVAIDLDAGKLYLRDNGAWRNGGPGSSGGLDLKLGQSYAGWVSSSVALDAALKAKVVDVNFGERGFVYALPDGYTPLDRAPPKPLAQ
jgi:uncharacterized protein YecT (DUF1311 family)